MPTLADALRGYQPPTTSALADPIVEHFRTLPQQLATNQQAMDKTMASMYKTDMGTGQPNPNYRPEAMNEFTQNYMPAIMGSTTAVRMAKAMENAMLPINQGGLGLPAGNTAAQRAKALGYETPVYHGTNADINAFNVEGKGKTAGAGAFLTTNPITAETYVSASGGGNILPLLLKKDDFLTANARGRSWADINTNELSAKSKNNRYTPQELGLDINSSTTTDELGMIANELSKKGVEIKNVKDLGPNSHVMRAKEYLFKKYGIVPDETWSNVTGKQWDESQKAMKKFYETQKSDIYAVQDPSLIRSRFAAFDPKRIKEHDILAAGAVLPLADEDNRRALLEKLFDKK